MGAALRHRIAGDDHRPLRLREQRAGGGDRGGIAAHARRDPRRSEQIEVRLGLEDVAGQREEHRAGRRRERGLRGAMHEARQVLDAVHLGRPFHERPRQGREIGGEHRLGDEIFEVLLAGGEQDRRRRLHRVVEHAHGVAEPGRDMEVEHGELARGLRIAVRHRHQRGFLQAEDVADVVLDRERIHQRQLGGAGIAEQDIDALLLQQLEEGTLSGHHWQEMLHRFEAERAGTIAAFAGGRKRRRSPCVSQPHRRHSGAGRSRNPESSACSTAPELPRFRVRCCCIAPE